MSDEKETYELAPADVSKPVTPPVIAPPGAGRAAPPAGVPGAASTAAATGVSPPTAPAPGLGKGKLLDDFDEDADFSKDPEVERVLKGVRGAISGNARPGDTRPVFVMPGRGSERVWMIVGAVLLVGGVIGAAVNAAHSPVVAAILVVYTACLQTVIGVGAVAVGAMLVQARLGPISLAGARMFVAVSAFLVVANMRITLVGGPGVRWEELTLGSFVYVGAVALLFKLWGRDLAYVVCSHFLLWVVVEIGMALSVWAGAAAPTGTPAPGA